MKAKSLHMAAAMLALLLLALGPARAPAAQSINFGVVAWSEALAVGSVIEHLLTEELGMEVRMTNPDIGVAYTAVKNKDMDLFIEAWLPVTHGPYWEKVSADVCDFGPIYENARLGWAVPAYIPEDQVASVEDLGKPAIKEKFGAKIIGIDPGSGLMQHSQKMMKQYEALEGWELVEGSDYAMVAALKRAMQREEWTVVTLWRPHFAFARFDIRFIDEPKKILGAEERIHMIGRQDFMSVFPSKVSEFLSRFYLPIEKVDALVDLYQEEEDLAAERFIEDNPGLVEYWLTGKTQ
jgi:glycine betaine/proline transport system substrate-binding protein